MEPPKHHGDPLAGMYVLAAIFLFVGGLVVVMMMFLRPNWDSRGEGANLYIPGTSAGFMRETEIKIGPPGVREVSPGKYEVILAAYNWSFSPNEIHVPAGSEVTFRAYSAEDYHGVMIPGTNVFISLLQQEVSEATHTFTEAGEYLFVCSYYCGGGHGSMVGRVIVN